MDLINKPSHYLHPIIPGLEARHVIENYPYHIATALSYLWRCGRKQGSKASDDLQKARQHIKFEIERTKRHHAVFDYRFAPWPDNAPGPYVIASAFSGNIASAMYALMVADSLRSLELAICYIEGEIIEQ
jgi:hypothetical protein